MLKKFALNLLIITLPIALSADQIEPKTLHLHFNESPFTPFDSVVEAMTEAVKESRLYPDAAIQDLVADLADYHSVKPNEIMIGNGLTSVIHTIADTFLTPQTKLITAIPTFELMGDFARKRGAEVIEVPLKEDYSHDLDAILEQVDASTKLIYICNPNNPTGSLTKRSEIEAFLEKLPPDVYVFLDEAYHQFAENTSDYASFIDRPIVNDHLIVGRTFSKAYSLAGMRLGYVISSAKTIDQLKAFKVSYTTNVAVMKGASVALKNDDNLFERMVIFKNLRDGFYKQANLRHLKYIPSHANFVMLETEGRSVKEVITHFKKHHIHIGREFSLMDHHVRITLGHPEEMEQFWKAWDRLP